MFELTNESNLPILPAVLFETDNLAVQMSVLLLIMGMIGNASLFVMDIIGYSTKHGFVLVVEQLFMSGFSMLLNVIGLVVHLTKEEMNLAYRVMFACMLVSNTVLGVICMLAKTKQMNELAERYRNESLSTANQHVQTIRRRPARSDDANRRDSCSYRIVNPGATFANEIMIPPNMRLESNLMSSSVRIPSYCETFRSRPSSEVPLVFSSGPDITEMVTSTSRLSMTEPSESLPSTNYHKIDSCETSELSTATASRTSANTCRVTSTTFHPATDETEEPSCSGLPFAESYKPTATIRRKFANDKDPEPQASTSRQQQKTPEKTVQPYKKRAFPLPSTSRASEDDSSVSYKTGDEYVKMNNIK